MSSDFLPSQDFHQMLVASFFFHLLLLTVWIFLPKAKFQTEEIIPAFMVSLEENYGGEIIEENLVKTTTNKLEVPSTQKPINESSIKSIDQKSGVDFLMQELNLLSGKKETKPILEELDLMAKVTVPKNIPRPKKLTPIKKVLRKLETLEKQIAVKKKILKKIPKKPTLIQEETIEEKPQGLISEKQSEILEIKPPISLENKLENFRSEKRPDPEDFTFDKPKNQAANDKTKYFQLSEAPESKESSKLASSNYENLIKDLITLQNNKKSTEGISPSETSDLKIAKITEKLSIIENLEKAKIDNNSPKNTAKEFKSKIRTAKIASNVEKASNPLALYVGKVKAKINSNWKIPLGIEHKKEILVSFFIFSGGNVGKPKLKTSSGKEMLDSMAIKAILDSSPFPNFPKDLKDFLTEPNIHITMRFKLTPNKKENENSN